LKASLRILLARIVDYAGLFPPAGLGMRETVTNYAAYRRSAEAWALGRLIVPASRLGELERVMRSLPSGGAGETPWALSVISGDDWEDDVEAIRAFIESGRDAAAESGAIEIGAVELKRSDSRSLTRVREAFPAFEIFAEVPIDSDPSEHIRVIADAGVFAKARTGGTEESMFPTTPQVARFIQACLEYKTAFKLTAGLHHALRSNYRLNYEPDSPVGRMHGFMNVFLAAGFLAAGTGKDDVASIIEESSPGAFIFGDDDVSWRSHRLAARHIESLRRNVALSFGSCSFDEPIADLREMNLL
jgi:hypothetical protein